MLEFDPGNSLEEESFDCADDPRVTCGPEAGELGTRQGVVSLGGRLHNFVASLASSRYQRVTNVVSELADKLGRFGREAE